MPGTVLLLAASPVGRGCLVDAASVLPVLAAVAPPVLSGTETANVVELADPLEPQAVLTRLRAAATAPGPLTMFVTGQLQLDRRQRLPHLALARTTPATVRYTAFPWRWVADELRLRPPGSTTVFVDLHADTDTWEFLAGRPLTAGPSTELYGRVAPPPSRRTVAQPAYMRAVATLLRSGHRPSPDQLHQQALTRIAGEENARPGAADLVLAPGRAWAGQPWPPAPEFTTVTAPPHAPAHPPHLPHPPVPPPTSSVSVPSVPSAPTASSMPSAPSVQLPGQACRRGGSVSLIPMRRSPRRSATDATKTRSRWRRGGSGRRCGRTGPGPSRYCTGWRYGPTWRCSRGTPSAVAVAGWPSRRTGWTRDRRRAPRRWSPPWTARTTSGAVSTIRRGPVNSGRNWPG